MALRIESGHPVTADVKAVEGKAVPFVTGDGRTMFEVRSGDDGQSIEVRAVEMTKHNGRIHSNHLLIEPRYANGVTVRAPIYQQD